jgi:HTH-type transcriptional regulator/antitoxin HipB
MRIRSLRDAGLVIRERRRALGLGQGELARQVGVSRQWLVEVERGKPRLDAGLLLRTLDALGLVVLIEDATLPAPGDALPATPDIDIDAVVENARGRPS